MKKIRKLLIVVSLVLPNLAAAFSGPDCVHFSGNWSGRCEVFYGDSDTVKSTQKIKQDDCKIIDLNGEYLVIGGTRTVIQDGYSNQGVAKEIKTVQWNSDRSVLSIQSDFVYTAGDSSVNRIERNTHCDREVKLDSSHLFTLETCATGKTKSIRGCTYEKQAD